MAYSGSRRELILLSGSHDGNYRDMTVGYMGGRQSEKGRISLDAVRSDSLGWSGANGVGI